MARLYAQPYDITARGFYFESAGEYRDKAALALNDIGQRVEEFEIQFIDGSEIDTSLARAWELNQANLFRFLEVVDEWDDWQKIKFIVAVGECGYDFDRDHFDPDDLEVEIHQVESLRAFAQDCIEDEWFGPVPEALALYIDYDAIARDLGIEYGEIAIAGQRYVYACR